MSPCSIGSVMSDTILCVMYVNTLVIHTTCSSHFAMQKKNQFCESIVYTSFESYDVRSNKCR